MRIIALLLVTFVALSHVTFLILEMFYWNDPVGREIFGTTPEFSATTAVLAANQGLYNGFLAAGLLWGLFDRPARPKSLLPVLRHRGRRLWRAHRQDVDPLRPGRAGAGRPAGRAVDAAAAHAEPALSPAVTLKRS